MASKIMRIVVNDTVTLTATQRGSATEEMRKNVALVCHPHPKLGGNAQNNVVVAVTRQLANQGWWNVALNTRGVGGSTGSATWTGTDEREDIMAACSQLVNEGAENILLVGYSFGACVASSVAEQIPNVRAVALVSYPCGMAASVLLSNHFPLAAQITKPLLWVTGDGDQFHSVQQSKGKFEQLQAANKTMRVIDNVDHFWFDREHFVGEALSDWLKEPLIAALFPKAQSN